MKALLFSIIMLIFATKIAVSNKYDDVSEYIIEFEGKIQKSVAIGLNLIEPLVWDCIVLTGDIIKTFKFDAEEHALKYKQQLQDLEQQYGRGSACFDGREPLLDMVSHMTLENVNMCLYQKGNYSLDGILTLINETNRYLQYPDEYRELQRVCEIQEAFAQSTCYYRLWDSFAMDSYVFERCEVYLPQEGNTIIDNLKTALPDCIENRVDLVDNESALVLDDIKKCLIN